MCVCVSLVFFLAPDDVIDAAAAVIIVIVVVVFSFVLGFCALFFLFCVLGFAAAC